MTFLAVSNATASRKPESEREEKGGRTAALLLPRCGHRPPRSGRRTLRARGERLAPDFSLTVLAARPMEHDRITQRRRRAHLVVQIDERLVRRAARLPCLPELPLPRGGQRGRREIGGEKHRDCSRHEASPTLSSQHQNPPLHFGDSPAPSMRSPGGGSIMDARRIAFSVPKRRERPTSELDALGLAWACDRAPGSVPAVHFNDRRRQQRDAARDRFRRAASGEFVSDVRGPDRARQRMLRRRRCAPRGTFCPAPA